MNKGTILYHDGMQPNMRQRLLIVGIFLIAAVTLGILSWQHTTLAVHNDDLLRIDFLDVGQGDAILLTTADGVQVLVDGGPDGTVVRELGGVLPAFDRTIDLVVATHLDKDHIGGLIDVLSRYVVSVIMQTNNEHATGVAELFRTAVVAEDATLYQPTAGQVYVLGATTTLTIFSPVGDVAKQESNAASIVAQVRYGDVTILLTGDAPIGIEEYLVRAYGNYLRSEVLKLGHHGSRTSTSELFVDSVRPTLAVVSAGKDNRYGHPHTEVIQIIAERNIPLLNTAVSGRVTLWSDGQTIWQ